MTTANPQSAAIAGKAALHQKLRPATSANRLDAELLSIVTTTLPIEDARQRFRRAAVIAAKAVGACHITKKNGKWQLDPNHKTGRVPGELDLVDEFEESLDQQFSAENPTFAELKCLDNLPGLFCRVTAAGADPELLLMIMPDRANSAKATNAVYKVVAAMEFWLKGHYASESEWQVRTLASIVELIGRIESCNTQQDAAMKLVNELNRALQCNSVAVATETQGNLRVEAISGIHKIDRGSATHQNYLQTMRESVLRESQAVFPAIDAQNDHMLLAHKQLASVVQTQAVVSQPLLASDGETMGAWVFTGDGGMLQNERFLRFVQTASTPVADALNTSYRAQKSWLRRKLMHIKSKFSWFTGLMIPLGILGICLLMLVPITYRVRCNCTTEPVSRRYAVAPFDGLIASGFVEPGDLVKQGQILAEIDGRTIRWELSGVSAEKKTSLRQREIELVDENIPKLFLAELENERLAAQEAVLEFKKDNLQIRSPIDGVVLSGSLERSEASSVETGQVLFEVGPIDAFKVQIEIPADEIAQVKVGHPVKIWIEGNEDEPLEAEIEKLHPRSQIREAMNVFIAELKFDNIDDRFRPGMKGSVRISCERRSLGWSMFHKPVNYVRSRLTWW